MKARAAKSKGKGKGTNTTLAKDDAHILEEAEPTEPPKTLRSALKRPAVGPPTPQTPKSRAKGNGKQNTGEDDQMQSGAESEVDTGGEKEKDSMKDDTDQKIAEQLKEAQRLMKRCSGDGPMAIDM